MTSTVTVGTFTRSVLLKVAEEGGYLAGQGLCVREVPVRSSPQQFKALLEGSLDIGLTSPDNALAYRFSPDNPLRTRVDVRIVSTVDRGLGLSLWCRPGLGRPGLLERDGTRRIQAGVDVATSGFALAMYALMDSLGLPRDAYDLVELGSTPQRMRALIAGECDVTMLNAGNDLLAGLAGCEHVADVSAVASPYVGTVVCVIGDAQVPLARALSLALRSAGSAIAAGEQDGIAIAAASESLNIPIDIARRFVHMLKDRQRGLIVGGDPDVAGLRAVVNLRRKFLPESVSEAGWPDLLESAFRAPFLST